MWPCSASASPTASSSTAPAKPCCRSSASTAPASPSPSAASSAADVSLLPVASRQRSASSPFPTRLPPEQVCFHVGDAVEEEDAVQVVHLVLEDDCLEPF